MNQLVGSIEDLLEDGQSLHVYVYADHPGRLANINPPSTIPSNISSTSDRHDLVLVSETEISILELTLCCNSPSGFSEAQRRKEENYTPLILDLVERGIHVVVSFVSLEIGTLGHFTKDAPTNLNLLVPTITKHQLRSILHTPAKAAIICSKYIYQAHKMSI